MVAMLLLSFSGIAQTTFTKITSASDLETGANYLIVAHHDDLGVLAMGYQKTSNRNAVVVEEDGDAITVTLGTDPNSETDVFQFTLGGSAGAWTLFDEVKGGYLYASSSSRNQLKTQTTNNANGEWSIVFNADGTAEVVAQGDNTRNNMRFNPNNGTPLFSCYAETSSVDTRVSFYKAGGSQILPEPTNYPTNFAAHPEGVDVTLTWIDAVGGQLPQKYLVLASTGDITAPTDGTPVPDGLLAKNVPYGTQTVTFSGLQGGTTYHFAIFPYTNSGATIDYKTDGNYPTASAHTEDINYLLSENFEGGDLGAFFAYDTYGEQYWHNATYNGNSYAYMNGYANGEAHQNEDWLITYVQISPNMVYNEVWLEFKTAKKYEGDQLLVGLSSNYDGVSDPRDNFHWEEITDAFDYSTGNYEWVESGRVDIAPMIPNYPTSFYIAFIYTSNDEMAAAWEVDDVKVMGTNVNDVNEAVTSVVSIYPNPAREQVSFMLDNDAEVSIFDMTGRLVSVTECKAGQAQIGVSELENGVYFVNFRFANGTTAVSKFVKL